MKRITSFLVEVPLVLWTILVVAPFILITLLGLRSNTDIYAHPLGVGGDYHPENFATAWQGPLGSAGMKTFFVNTLETALVAWVVNLGAGAMGAYFATRLSATARLWYLRIFLVATIVPFMLLLTPYYQAYSVLGWLDHPAALGLAYGSLALPTTVMILVAYFLDFPNELREAAAVDGLGPFSTFLRIVLPLSRGALTSVSMLLIIWVWNETQLAIALLQRAESQTVAVGLLGFRGQFTFDLGPLFAGLTLASVPLIAIYLAFNKTITKGIALGGVSR